MDEREVTGPALEQYFQDPRKRLEFAFAAALMGDEGAKEAILDLALKGLEAEKKAGPEGPA